MEQCVLHAGYSSIKTILSNKVLLDEWHGDVFITNKSRGIDVVKIDDVQTFLAGNILIELRTRTRGVRPSYIHLTLADLVIVF